MALPYMEEEIADAIMDWRDGDDEPQAQGAEAGYYENLPIPYKIRNGPLQDDSGAAPGQGSHRGAPVRRGHEPQRPARFQREGRRLSPPVDNGDEYLDQGWIAYLTCYSYEKNVDAEGNSRVNINQADQQQLAGWTRHQGLPGEMDRRQSRRGVSEHRGSDQRQESQDLVGRARGGNQDQAEPIDMQTFGQIADQITISGEEKIPGKDQHQHGAAGSARGALRRGRSGRAARPGDHRGPGEHAVRVQEHRAIC